MRSIFKPDQWSVAVITPPGSLVVDTAAMKLQLNLSDDDDLVQLAACIAQSQEHLEQVLGRALLVQTWSLSLSGFPSGQDCLIILPGGFVGSVISVVYNDVDGVSQTLPTSVYSLHNFGKSGRGHLALKAGQSWPVAQDGGMPVVVSYQVGWPDLASVPPTLIGCVRMLAGTLFDESRGAYADKPYQQAQWYRSMLANWRVPRWLG